MNAMNKKILSGAITLALGSISTAAGAALTTSAVLEFDPGYKYCVYGEISPGVCKFAVTGTGGSYFTMDTNSNGVTDNERSPISMHDGLIIGIAQPASGSHAGPPNGTESPGIDEPWQFFSNTGLHKTNSPVTVVTDSGTTKTLDFSGWTVTWSGIPDINMGGGMQNCGTTTDGICVDTFGNDIGGTYNNGSGLATITCSSSSCSASSSFTLDYAAVVPQADPSNFGGVKYTLHLEGHVAAASAVPLPAAAWLLGSGLAGVIGIARRRRVRERA